MKGEGGGRSFRRDGEVVMRTFPSAGDGGQVNSTE